MKLKFALSAVIAASVIQFAAAAAGSPDPYANETPAQRDARFGMFIHWGVYSVPAGTYDGKLFSTGPQMAVWWCRD